MASKVDVAVKGTASAAKEKEAASSPTSGVTNSNSPSDPLAHLPSSPPQIYLNLLILECSLRTQYLELRARRRQHTFFLTLLLLWTTYFSYALFLAPREDGRGVGGSVYWVIEMGEKVAFMGGVITGVLVWGTGQWERGVRWPRRWVGVTNRGLRGFNLKIVVVKRGMLLEWWDTLRFFLDGGLWRGVDNTNYRFIPPSLQDHDVVGSRRNSNLPNITEDAAQSPVRAIGQSQQEDLSAGGDTISLLLLPKPFSPSFRENWDLYRTSYWERENARRATLSTKLRAHDAAVLKKARAEAGWFPWLRSWPLSSNKPSKSDFEKNHHYHHHTHGGQHAAVSALKSEKRRSSIGPGRSGSHSRNSSRASTPLLEPVDSESAGVGKHSRRGSTASSASDKRRKRTSVSGSSTTTANSGNSISGAAASEKRMQKLTSPSGNRATTTSASDGEGSGSASPAIVATNNNSHLSPKKSSNVNAAAGGGDGNAATDGSKKPPGSPLIRENSFNSVSSFEIEREESVGPDGEELRRSQLLQQKRRKERLTEEKDEGLQMKQR